jgi:hypothetical protein
MFEDKGTSFHFRRLTDFSLTPPRLTSHRCLPPSCFFKFSLSRLCSNSTLLFDPRPYSQPVHTLVQTHLQPPPLPLVETHARPIRRTRVGTGRRQGFGRSAGGGDQEVDLKVRNPVLGICRVEQGGSASWWDDRVLGFYTFGRNFLLLHVFWICIFITTHSFTMASIYCYLA